jgi:hypothetical protein
MIKDKSTIENKLYDLRCISGSDTEPSCSAAKLYNEKKHSNAIANEGGILNCITWNIKRQLLYYPPMPNTSQLRKFLQTKQ